jgi:hypothetical protein
MRSYFTPKPKTSHPLPPTAEPHGVQLEVAASKSGELNKNNIFIGYLSDDEPSGSDKDDSDDELTQTNLQMRHLSGFEFHLEQGDGSWMYLHKWHISKHKKIIKKLWNLP